MSKVSVVQSPQSYQGTLQVLKPLEQSLVNQLQDLKKIVIKINFVTTKNELATTPCDCVKAFVNFVKPFYSGKIIIAEEASIGNTNQGFEKHGFNKIANDNPQVELFDSANDKTTLIEVKYPHGTVTLPISQIYLPSSYVVSICRAKTHDSVVVTLSLKNLLVGAIQGGLSSRGMIHQGQDINWILQQLAKHVYPNLSIIDGVIGMQGNGPGGGDPIQANWLIASEDALATDSLATYLMGFDIKDVGYLNLIKELNLGKLYPIDKLELLGQTDLSSIKTIFKPHQTFLQQRQWKQQ